MVEICSLSNHAITRCYVYYAVSYLTGHTIVHLCLHEGFQVQGGSCLAAKVGWTEVQIEPEDCGSDNRISHLYCKSL